MAQGVEWVDGSHTNPPVMKTSARKKQTCEQMKTQDERRQQEKIDNKVSGTYQARSKSVNSEATPNSPIYLTKAITVHISDKQKQESFIKAAINAKPKDRDTLRRDIFLEL